MRIEPVTEANFEEALRVYIRSWGESHRDTCTPEYIAERDYPGYLRYQMDGLHLIRDTEPVGVFRIKDGVLSDLYIHPDQVGKGYGTACVEFAKGKCGDLRLTVLSSNKKAIRLYEKLGFRFMGKILQLRADLWEQEMVYTEKKHD